MPKWHGHQREDLSGDTCRELPQALADAEVELREAAQLSEPFGEWQVRQEPKNQGEPSGSDSMSQSFRLSLVRVGILLRMAYVPSFLANAWQ